MVFKYFLDINSKFDRNIKMVAFCLSIALGIRNTSIIGWIPLLAIKLLQTKALVTFIKAAFFVALPTLLGIVIIDSLHYRQLTITAYNFILINVL